MFLGTGEIFASRKYVEFVNFFHDKIIQAGKVTDKNNLVENTADHSYIFVHVLFIVCSHERADTRLMCLPKILHRKNHNKILISY